MTSDIKKIEFKLANGEAATLNDFKNKVILLVNVASECGLTPQYDGLEKLYTTYQEEGFTVLGFPANEFGAQEPGTNEEIQNFCKGKFGVRFPVAQKIVVKGNGIHPLYASLIANKPNAVQKKDGTLRGVLAKHNLLTGNENEIMWNFEKFLIGRNGDVVARFAPDMEPNDEIIVSAIKTELAK